MRIGIAFNLKKKPLAYLPEDIFEELDSLETVEAIESVLNGAGHETVRLGGGMDFLLSILKTHVDIVFNTAEGWGTRSREEIGRASCRERV